MIATVVLTTTLGLTSLLAGVALGWHLRRTSE